MGKWSWRVMYVLFGLTAMLVSSVAPAGATRNVERIVGSVGQDEAPFNLPVGFLDPDFTFAVAGTASAITGEGAKASPDGNSIILTIFDGLWLARADVSDGAFVTHAPPGHAHQYPSWSPSGDRVAFTRKTPAGTQVSIVDVASKAVVHLTPPQMNFRASGLDWSPDGDTIVWSGEFNGNGKHVIATVSVADGSTVEIASGRFPVYSPNGKRIAYVKDGFLTLMNHDGTGFDPTAQAAEFIAWSDDNVEIAYSERHLAGIYDTSTDEGRISLTGIPGETNYYIWDWAFLEWPTFNDVPFSSPFSDDVEWMADEDITKGCDPPINRHYCPTDTVTRGEMAAFLARALELTERLDDPFVDDDNSTFEADIERIAAAGITMGCNPPKNDRFCPDELVTRGEMAAFISRAAELTEGGNIDWFVDDNGSTFETDINRLATAGITKGCNPPINDHYCPNGLVTRQHMAAFMHRAFGD